MALQLSFEGSTFCRTIGREDKNVPTPVTRAMPMEKDLDHAHDCKLDDTLTTWTYLDIRISNAWVLELTIKTGWCFETFFIFQ